MDSSIQPGRTLAGRYRIDAPLGRGGTGVVWRATDSRLDRAVAVKVLAGLPSDEAFVGSRLIAATSSPHVVRVLDLGRTDDAAFVVMELVAGPDLRQLVAEDGPLPAGLVAAIGCQLARALGAVHEQGSTHGDVTPANVLLSSPSGIVKLGDFGSVRGVDAEPGPVGWTVDFVSPQRLDGAPACAGDDLYALGLVLWTALAGRPPFQGDSQAIRAVARGLRDPQPIGQLRPDVPGVLAAAIAELTSRDPAGRPRDAVVVARALEELVGTRPWGPVADHLARRGPGERDADASDLGVDVEELAVRLATMAHTQATTDRPDPVAIARVAGGSVAAIARARELVPSIARDDEAAGVAADQFLASAAALAPAAPPPASVDDPTRRRSLARAGLLDSPIEEAFESASRLAARLLGVPVSLVSIVDEDRQFFKSQQGLPEPWASERETPLSHSFCRYVVETDHPLRIEDARHHPLVSTNEAVPDLGVVGYLGVPLADLDGTVLGSFCVITDEPRAWTADDLETLADVAGLVHRELRVRAAAAALVEQAAESRATASRLAADLCGPLDVLAGGVDTLRRLGPDTGGPLADLLTAMERQAEQSLAIARALVGGADRAAPETSVRLADLVLQLVHGGGLPDGAPERVRVDVPDDLLLSSSPVVLEQVLVHLVGHGLRHTAGPVDITAETLPGGGIELRVRHHQPQGDTSVSPISSLDVLIVRRLVERLGGSVRAEDATVGSGAGLAVLLPEPRQS